MKVLSIRQPWAWLICHGHKPIENRTWATKFRGQFLVHAGKSLDREGHLWVRSRFPRIQMPQHFELGGIVGEATLVDCVPPDAQLADEIARWYAGEYGFVIADAHAHPFEPLRGQLGFFNYAGNAREAICAAETLNRRAV